jgi:hypothetical protein
MTTPDRRSISVIQYCEPTAAKDWALALKAALRE